MNAFFTISILLLTLPQVLLAQSANDREVLTEEQYNKASADRQEEIRNNPDAFVVVKDGQKVDVWNRELKQGPTQVEEEEVSHAQRIEMERQAQEQAEVEQREVRQRQKLLEEKPWLMSEEEQAQYKKSSEGQEVEVVDDERSANWDDANRGSTQQPSPNHNVSNPSPSDAVPMRGDDGGSRRSIDQTISVEEYNKLLDREKKGHEN